ncbi:hypothetical protein Tco_1098634 [Tanacetum coccineum]
MLRRLLMTRTLFRIALLNCGHSCLLLLMINFYHLLVVRSDTEPVRMLVGNKFDLDNIRAMSVEELSVNMLGLTNNGDDDFRQNLRKFLFSVCGVGKYVLMKLILANFFRDKYVNAICTTSLLLSKRLCVDTEIKPYNHMDLCNEVDLDELTKMPTDYGVTKELAIKGVMPDGKLNNGVI